MRMSCLSALRKYVCDAIENEKFESEVKHLFYDVAKERSLSLDLWLHNMRDDKTWGSATKQ